MPEQPPLSADHFAHLDVREASIASLIDMLVEGAVISGKALAAAHPLYGQAACLSALNILSQKGHLRRVRERLDLADGRCRWVTRTYFSRVPHDDAWWEAFCEHGHPPASPQPPADPPPPAVRPPAPSEPPRTVAYDALAGLCRIEPRLTLSAADCTALAPLAAAWPARDPSRARFDEALTTGLPTPVHSPAALLRSRLLAKLPPKRPAEPPEPVARRMLECTRCRNPGRPEALPGGLCADCRAGPHRDHGQPDQPDISAHVDHLRQIIHKVGRHCRRRVNRDPVPAGEK